MKLINKRLYTYVLYKKVEEKNWSKTIFMKQHTHTLTYIELRTRKKQNKTLDSAPINHCKRNS